MAGHRSDIVVNLFGYAIWSFVVGHVTVALRHWLTCGHGRIVGTGLVAHTICDGVSWQHQYRVPHYIFSSNPAYHVRP